MNYVSCRSLAPFPPRWNPRRHDRAKSASLAYAVCKYACRQSSKFITACRWWASVSLFRSAPISHISWLIPSAWISTLIVARSAVSFAFLLSPELTTPATTSSTIIESERAGHMIARAGLAGGQVVEKEIAASSEREGMRRAGEKGETRDAKMRVEWCEMTAAIGFHVMPK